MLIRQVLEKELNKAPGLVVVGTASNPIEARQKIPELEPDVVTLDSEMPKMNGLMFLDVLNKIYPVPVVMLSTLIPGGGSISKSTCGTISTFFPSPDTERIS